MGLDIFCDGGRYVRVLIQGCLILSLWLANNEAFANTMTRTQANAECSSDPLSGYYDPGVGKTFRCTDLGLNPGSDTHGKVVLTYPGRPSPAKTFRYEITPCAGISHEPDINGYAPTDSCECANGWIDSTAPGSQYQCVIQRDAGECAENGELFDPVNDSCVLECPNGHLNGVCLGPPEDPQECTNDTPDYRGEVVLGYGKAPIKMCGDYDQCQGEEPGQVGFFNGELRCIAEDYGDPECEFDTVLVVDEYGFVCEPLTNKPEEDIEEEEPNTDTDGDGEPDEYDPNNDPNINTKQNDQLIEEGKKTNESLDGIADQLGALREIGKDGNKAIKDGFDENHGLLKQINDNLDGDGASGPDLPAVGTFAHSSGRMKTAITGQAFIASVTTIPTIATSTQCPTWTIPSNDYWSALTVDAHCPAIEGSRSILAAIFTAMWTLVAGVVFLRA